MTKERLLQNLPWLAMLSVVALMVFVFTFNPKPDYNGDNCHYYANATSLVQGRGYTDMFGEPTNNFPPGYPLLMAPLRMLTDSVVAQKIQNLVFIFLAVLLQFFLLVKLGLQRCLAFIACVAVLVTPHILEFSTMMMSEASCILFFMLAFWLYLCLPDDERVCLRAQQFYLLLFVLVFSFYIRTQAVAIVVAFLLTFILARKLRLAVVLLLTFIIAYIPWAIRNYMLGLEQSRYVSQIDYANILGTLKMLFVQAIPESVVPFFDIDYNVEPTVALWLLSMAMLAVILYGIYRLGRITLPLLLLFMGTMAIVSLINTPSQYRYIIIILPFLTVAFVVGLYNIGKIIAQKLFKCGFSPWLLVILFLPMFLQRNIVSKHTLTGLYVYGRMKTPDNYQNFYEMGERIYELDKNAIVATRKPDLLYLHSGIKARNFLETDNDTLLIQDLIEKKVDLVIVDQLGFKGTFLYLAPCVRRHRDIFRPLLSVKNPDTFLFIFDRKLAIRRFGR